jgi:hypothetical protein
MLAKNQAGEIRSVNCHRTRTRPFGFDQPQILSAFSFSLHTKKVQSKFYLCTLKKMA